MIMRKDFTITKEQILDLHSTAKSGGKADTKMRNWFPEVFTQQLPHNFTGWCKIDNCGNDDWLMFFNCGIQKYGIDSNGDWFVPAGTSVMNQYSREATESEVLASLKKESNKRYNFGSYVKCLANAFLTEPDCIIEDKENKTFMSGGSLWITANRSVNVCVFRDGKWAEIIPTITKSEAEKQLGMKIID